ncbi:glycerophosphotransferase [Sphingomonas rosea]|uniref:Glycerophosphotransferase n=1 Tax=Sphingomonas rosea TaxID=335605 RepID=A0ABP7U955_9SPHN
MSGPVRIAFPLIGGGHQAYHTVPVACALSQRPGVEVVVFAGDSTVRAVAEEIAGNLPGSTVRFSELRRSKLADGLGSLLGKSSLGKEPMLWRNRRELGAFDAIVTPEVTSSRLRSMGVTSPKFICIPHGAGDRAVSFEPRFQRFDRLLVAGDKTARRLEESGVRPDRLRITGYPKAEYVLRVAASRPPLFANDRPTVLYNPHFLGRLSSLGQAEAIARAIIEQTEFNLVLAPHIRAFEDADASTRARWQALAIPGRVIVDTGSEKLIDMSYTAAADIYLGDVSSQVYEFLLLGLRPCVFVDAHQVDWRDDPDYAFWRLGDVVSPGDAAAACQQARARHADYRVAQEMAVAETFSPTAGAAARAADEILACVAGGA